MNRKAFQQAALGATMLAVTSGLAVATVPPAVQAMATDFRHDPTTQAISAYFRHDGAPTVAAQHLDVNTARLDQLMADPRYKAGVEYTREMMDIHMKHVGSIAGYSSDTAPPASPTMFSFTRDGKTVYVDYGLNSQSKTLQELEKRAGDGKAFVDLRYSNVAKLDPTSPFTWDPADYIKGVDYAPNHRTLPAFKLTKGEAHGINLAPTIDTLAAALTGPTL